jgi:CheY-like chemotaxis protein
MRAVGPLIYVVDDETIFAQTLMAVLIGAGFRAVAFNDPKAVLLALSSKCPDVLLSDVIMPGTTGIDLAICIREAHPECKVLLLSGEMLTSDLLEKASREGHNFDCVEKPIHPKELLAKLRNLV